MNFDNIIGNDKIKLDLNKIIQTNNVLHSYMFVGQEGIGKKLFAIEFAKKILCINKEFQCLILFVHDKKKIASLIKLKLVCQGNLFFVSKSLYIEVNVG